MTNQDRIDAQTAATALIERMVANKADLQKAREAAQTLASALLDLECCVGTVVERAKKVRDMPRAEQLRDLKTSKSHLESFGRKRARIARRQLERGDRQHQRSDRRRSRPGCSG